MLMRSGFADPLNLGQDLLISINGLLELVSAIAGVEVERRRVPGPQGVRGRNSDDSRLNVLQWEPSVTLEAGLEQNLPLDRRPGAEVLGRRRFGRRLDTGQDGIGCCRSVSLWIGSSAWGPSCTRARHATARGL